MNAVLEWLLKLNVCDKFQFLDTPWKIDMEPTNHPFRKEHDLPNLHDYVPCQSSQGIFSCERKEWLEDDCCGAVR